MTHEVTVRKKEQEGGKAGGTLAPALAVGPGAGRRPSRASVPLGGEGQRRAGRRRASRCGVPCGGTVRPTRRLTPRHGGFFLFSWLPPPFQWSFMRNAKRESQTVPRRHVPRRLGKEGGPRQQPPRQPSARRTAFPDCKLTLFLIICFAVGAADLTSEGQSCICLNDQKQYTFYPQTPRLENYLKN